MKKIKIITYILCTVLLWNCDDDYKDYTAPDQLSDAAWLIGTNSNSQLPYSINANTHISFLDLSQGTVSHEWQIQDGNHYLKEGFGINDSLPLYINNEVGLTIDTPKAHVFFRNSGTNTVRLLNKFSEPVTYNFSGGSMEAVQEGNLWVIDTTFNFDVFATIKPAFKVLQNGTEILNITEDNMPSIGDISTWPTVDVEAATTLTFVDMTTVGRPNARSWRYPDGTPTQTGGETANVKFYRLGTFTGEMRSFRIAPNPTANVTKLIPIKVNVIPSSQPFVFSGNLKEDETEKISFQVNGESLSFSGQEANFTVNVMNTASGFNQNIPVQQAQVSSDDATFIDLTLTQPIYNSDQITISYNNASNGIVSADSRVLQSFNNESVGMYFGNNILPSNGWASFETSGGGVNNAFASNQYFIPGGQGNGQFGDLIWERVTTNSVDGAASMRYKLPNTGSIPTVNLFGFSFAKPNGIPAGTYKISYKVFKENSTLNAFRMDFGNPVTDTKIFDISSINNNQWVEVSKTITFSSPLPTNYRTTLRILAVNNPGVSGEQLVYFDDLSLIELEPRI